ncbi:putative entry exclusion protein TrbK-alt [Bradyrhizobium manausense]
MSDTGPFKALSLLTTIGILVVAACTIQLRRGEDTSAPPKAEQTTDVDGSDIARCRTITSEDAAGYQHCQQIWAENRRRFFGKKESTAASRGLDPVAGRVLAPKDQSRIPQGYPSVALPEASKP